MKGSTRDIQATLREAVIPEGATRHGVVIGIESYRDERLNLRCAKADAEAMRDLMVDPDCGLFEPENVTCLVNSEATKEAVWSALASLRRRAGKNDTVWIYYAGHGAFEGTDYYWVPADADVDDLYSSGLSQQQINQVLCDLGAERVLVMLDCCYASATAVQKNPTRATVAGRELLQSYQGTGRIVLSASDLRERSVELPEVGHGAFTHFLVRGLRGEADPDRTGVVQLDGLWSYLDGKVSEVARKVGNTQTPRLSGELSHQFSLTLNPLEVGHRRDLAKRIREMIGIENDELSTEEARHCLAALGSPSCAALARLSPEEVRQLADGELSIHTLRKVLSDREPEVAVTSSPPVETPRQEQASALSIAVPVDDPWDYRDLRQEVLSNPPTGKDEALGPPGAYKDWLRLENPKWSNFEEWNLPIFVGLMGGVTPGLVAFSVGHDVPAFLQVLGLIGIVVGLAPIMTLAYCRFTWPNHYTLYRVDWALRQGDYQRAAGLFLKLGRLGVSRHLIQLPLQRIRRQAASAGDRVTHDAVSAYASKWSRKKRLGGSLFYYFK